MSSTALKVVAIVTVLLAVILAFAAYRMSRQFAESAEQAAQQVATPPQTVAVVATQPLAAYRPIDRDAVTLAPVAVLPRDYFATLDDVVGRTPLVDVDTGAPVTGRYFRETNAMARLLPAGHRALSLEVNDVIAVGGFLRPGDIVDVLVFLRGGAGVGEAQARVLEEALRVLAYEERIIDRPQGLPAEEDGDRRRRQRTAVLAVPEDRTTRLMLGMGLGDVRLALHGQASPLPPLTQAELLAREPGLPETEEATAEAAARKVPDQAVTASQLSEIKPPPAAARPPPRHRIVVHRGSATETVLD